MNDIREETETRQPLEGHRSALALLFLAFTLSITDRMILSILFPDIKSEFGVSEALLYRDHVDQARRALEVPLALGNFCQCFVVVDHQNACLHVSIFAYSLDLCPIDLPAGDKYPRAAMLQHGLFRRFSG